jgi:hypothetical protein
MSLAARLTPVVNSPSVDWSVCWWRCDKGKALPHRQTAGQDRSGFWRLVMELLSSEGEVWCFSSQANACMTALGLWDRIEEGTVRLHKDGAQAGKPGDRDSLPVLSDYMMLHDPPFMVKLAIPGRPGRMVVVDTRNYGLSSPEQCSSPTQQAIATGVLSAAALHGIARASGPTLQATAASTAYAWWRLRYLRSAVLVHTHGDCLALERQAIHGGRCEAYYIGTVPEKCAHLDIRSAYPAVAMTTALPVRLLHYGETNELPNYSDSRGSVGYIAEVTANAALPVAPYRKDGITIYPVGRFRTVLCGPELDLLRSSGRVVKIHRWASYEMEPILAEFQTELWGYRQDALKRGDLHADELFKRLMNGIIGKFAQRGRYWDIVPNATAPKPFGTYYEPLPGGRFECRRSVNWIVQRLVDRGESADSCPAIAAWIYSEARVRLWRLMEKAGRGNVWYVDTDSLFVNASGGRRLSENPEIPHGEIGGLRDVEGFEALTLFGVKDYKHGERRVKAGPMGNQPADVVGGVRDARSPKAGVYRHGVVSERGDVRPWEVWE